MRGSLPWVMGAGCPSPPALSFCGVQGAFLPYLVGVLKHGRGNPEQMQETHLLRAERDTAGPSSHPSPKGLGFIPWSPRVADAERPEAGFMETRIPFHSAAYSQRALVW